MRNDISHFDFWFLINNYFKSILELHENFEFIKKKVIFENYKLEIYINNQTPPLKLRIICKWAPALIL